MTQPIRPPERYGDDVRARRRRPAVIVWGVVAVAAASLVTWFGLAAGSADVRGELANYRVAGDTSVVVRILVTKDASDRAVCRLRARSSDFGTVGTAEVTVPSGGAHTRSVTVSIPTRSRAVNGELLSCQRA